MEKKLQHPKIINDPVHGFIEIPRGIILDLIDTPEFQRLRRIKQLGLSCLVYPGAMHTRFNHALGAMHLMRQALDVLRRKAVPISEEEYESTLIAILLHDIGHGPFSHSLETTIIQGLDHEQMSMALMKSLNDRFQGKLELAIDIFNGTYHRRFLHQLVSSQLDMDRMDYLVRDSFFTGVVEGLVGVDRIIKILNVYEGRLVCESKGIYSVEKFIVARRLMYWQVYLHKAAVSAELMVVKILKRAKELALQGENIYLPDNLSYFFFNEVKPDDLNEMIIGKYIQLDDIDIEFALKQWQQAQDAILSRLCQRVLNRKLFKITFRAYPYESAEIEEIRQKAGKELGLGSEALSYFIFEGELKNQAYLDNDVEPILIWNKTGELMDIATASDMKNIRTLAKPVVKHFLCTP